LAKGIYRISPIGQTIEGFKEGYVSTSPDQLPTATRALIGAVGAIGEEAEKAAKMQPGAGPAQLAERMKSLGDEILSTRLRRGLANAIVPLAEGYATWETGSFLARPLTGRIAAGAATKIAEVLGPELSAGTAESIAAASAKATRTALVSEIKQQ